MPPLEIDVDRAERGTPNSAHLNNPTVVLLPNTPPTANLNRYHAPEYDVDVDILQVPSLHSASHDKHQSRRHEPLPGERTSQQEILTALAIGAPLIASVVSSCTAVICADMTAAMNTNPRDRPARASAIVALLWSALITSLGSTMTAVAGLAIHAGYHDSHVGVTKRILRFLRSRFHGEVHPNNHPVSNLHPGPAPSVLSAITDRHVDTHRMASFRAAVISARLLGSSVALLSMAMAVYLFLLYPLSVALSVLSVGLITTAAAILPMLPILMHRS